MAQPDQSPTFAAKVNRFNAMLHFPGELPPGIEVMNPFRENDCATPASIAFYDKFYDDHQKRGILLGINPGRFGAGITGVPFTDPQRLRDCCGISLPQCPKAREPSSEFVYEVINLYGGVEKFFSRWYVNSICPLGFTKKGPKGTPVNYIFYDSPALEKAATPFILQTLPRQIDFGIHTQACVCMGMGKNSAFLAKINREKKFFKKIISVEHPRYIIQYKSGQRKDFAKKYLEILKSCEELFES